MHFVRRRNDSIVFPRRHCSLFYVRNSGWQSSIKRPLRPSQISSITTSESILIKSRNRCPRSFFHGQSQPITSVCREQGLYWISSIFVRAQDTKTTAASHRHFRVWFRFYPVRIQCSMHSTPLIFSFLSSFYMCFTFILAFFFPSFLSYVHVLFICSYSSL
jgi:hypothetical protein